MSAADFNLGINAAAQLLTKTAEDLEQGLTRRREQNTRDRAANRLGWSSEWSAINQDEEKARLLRGQVLHIQKLAR